MTSKQCLQRVFAVLLLCAVAFPTAIAQETSPTPERVLAISTTPVLDPPLTPENAIERFTDAIQQSVEAGATGNFVAKTWSELEPTPNTYALDDLGGDLVYRTGSYNQVQFIGIQPLNTTARETPSDLLDVPFDSPEMITRFERLFDALVPVLTNHNVRYISIGNEVDVYLSAHPDEWQAYTQFYESALEYIHKSMPEVNVGVTATFSGMSANFDEIMMLNAKSDVFMMTYYPLNMDFTPRNPDAPLTDFPQMLEWAGERPLILQEVGYPSAESLNSSEQKQADFVKYAYEAWDIYAADIPFLNFFLMGDFSKEMCDAFLIYYGLPNTQQFYDFLCTLGFKQADGTPRLAWRAFIEGGQALGE